MIFEYFTKPILAFLFIILLAACGNNETKVSTPAPSVEKTRILLDWFEANGNYISSPSIPSIIDAQVVYAKQNDNLLIIDLRPEAAFHEGHIQHAVNISRSEILDYFRYSIEPAAFESIIIVCNNGNASGYVTSILRLLGFENVYNMRFGMSGWDKSIAEQHWLANIGDTLMGKMDFKGYEPNKPGEFPALEVNGITGFKIAWERAEAIIAEPMENFNIPLNQVMGKWEDYYLMCYWPNDKYLSSGHLPGATQYTPKKSLHKGGELNTLSLEKPNVIYCYSGQHSVFVAAYLRMLGYDAKSLAYGANGFIHSEMARTEPRPTRTFTEKLIQGLPLVKSGQSLPFDPNKEIPTETTSVAGGC
jgi:rhodanese-related sulfurtransferase